MPLLTVGLMLATIFAGFIPGLHGDEAWVVLRVVKITNGERPFSGMNFYTGALNEYLAWPFLVAAGYRFCALRVASALVNVLAVLFALDIVRTLHPDDPVLWFWTGALWVTSVTFVLDSRFGVEMSMLSPALLLGGLWLITVALRSQSQVRLWAAGLGSGFMLGVGVYNHLVTIAVVAALGLGALAGFGTSLFRCGVTWLVAAGLFIGLTPTVIRLVETAHQSAYAAIPPVGTSSLSQEVAGTLSALVGMLPSLRGPMGDLPALPGEMASIIDGGIMFQRFTGERLVPVIPYFSVALLGLGAACWWRTRHQRLARIDRAMLVAWLAMPIAVLLIAPYLALGYFEFPALVAPYALARFALPSVREDGAPSRFGQIGRVVLGAVLALQISYIAVDYFWALARSGGRPSWFKLGSRLTETSEHFIRTDRLYRQLVAAGVHEVIAPKFLGWDLEAQDLPFHHLYWVHIRTDGLQDVQSPRTKVGRVAFLLTSVGKPHGASSEDILRTMQRFVVGRLKYVRASGFDQNFMVFICEQGAQNGR